MENSEEDPRIEDKAKEYEEIFEEIQNFDIPEKALDKIEEVLDENISLIEENRSMAKELECIREELEAKNFKSVLDGLKKRMDGSLSEDFRPVPPPPPTPCNIKLKFRTLFWKKVSEVSNSVFEDAKSFKFKSELFEKFPLTSAKPVKPVFESRPKALEYNREIVVSSSLRTFCLSFDDVIRKIEKRCFDWFNDRDRVKALIRVLPCDNEVEMLNQLVKNGQKLSQNEEFLFKLSKFSFLRSFLDCIEFKINFSETLADLKSCFKNWKTVCLKVRTNKRLQTFLQLLLSFGNELNKGHPKCGQAAGYKLSILSSLSSFKSSKDGSSLLEVLVEEFFSYTGYPHLFHRSEHLLLKELSTSSFSSLLETYEKFFQDFSRFASVSFEEPSDSYIKEFIKSKTKEIEELVCAMTETKDEIKKFHEYFLEVEEVDEEGRFCLFKELAGFFDRYLEVVCKRWTGLSNRDSRRFTMEFRNK